MDAANGTLIWYYSICKREVWLMHHNIVPDQKDENIEIGRFLHETSYSRNKKEIEFGHIKFDVMLQDGDELVIGETKKSSKFEEASRWQLMYYLAVLKEAGIFAKGVLLYPTEKKRVEVILDEGAELKLAEMVQEIDKICAEPFPPPVKKISFCRSCGYREYCYA